MTNILVTGDRGYVGSIFCSQAIDAGYTIQGYDLGLYDDYYVKKINSRYNSITGDVRDLNYSLFNNIDVVVVLAALSNDPLGEFNKQITFDINYSSAVQTAKIAKKAGVRKMIFLSSQSIYGISNTDLELEEDTCKISPVTAYAEAKWLAEQELLSLASSDFCITMLRPATVFGASPSMRCDIVYNNLIASAFTSGKIIIKSDGTPWRPILYIKDLSSAILAVIKSENDIVNRRAYNVGIKNGNYTVKQIATAASEAMSGCQLVYTNEHVDQRTYKVNFNRIYDELGKNYQPTGSLILGGQELINFYKKISLSHKMLNGPMTNRLMALREQISFGKFSSQLERI